ALPPGSATLVILMGIARRKALSDLLITRGWSRATPAAVCRAAGTAHAHTWIGTLDALSAAPGDTDGDDAPGTIVVGDVVSIGASIVAALFPRPAAPAASRVD